MTKCKKVWNKFVKQNQDEDDKIVDEDSTNKGKVHKRKRKSTPLNSKNLNSHFITKYLNKLRKNVEIFDIYKATQNYLPIKRPETPTRASLRGSFKREKNCSISDSDHKNEDKLDLPSTSRKQNYSTMKFRGQTQSPLSKYL